MVATMAEIGAVVWGEPKPQPRARSFVLRGKGGKPILKNGEPILMVHDPHTAEHWKEEIAKAVKPCLLTGQPMDGPVRLVLGFVMPRPKGHYGKKGLLPSAPRHHLKKPDIDNLEKAVTDTLKTVGVYRDDTQVVDVAKTKRYVTEGEAPHMTLRITAV